MNAPVDISAVVLTTDRLTLRPFVETDLDDFFEYARVDGVGQAAGWLPHNDKEESRAILQNFIDGKKTFAVECAGKVVGSVGVEPYDENQLPELSHLRARELGYALSKDYWNRGLMTEAVKRVIRYLFEEVRLDVIVCGHFPDNVRSARVQEKCGFADFKTVLYRTRYGVVKDCVLALLYR